MRGSLDIETGGSGAAPLDWVIQTNAASPATTLSPEERMNAARNSGAWQTIAIHHVMIAPAYEDWSILPVLPRSFIIDSLVFTLPLTTFPKNYDMTFNAELQVYTPGGSWDVEAYFYDQTFESGAYALKVEAGDLALNPGRTYKLVVQTGAYATDAGNELYPWIFGIWADDLS